MTTATVLKNKVKNVLMRRLIKGSNFSRVSYSQAGEDLIIDSIFGARKIENPSYLDIGAHHPYYFSNTAYFYLKGSRGVNVEPNPLLIGSFFVHRKRDINLNVGIGSETGNLEFYVMDDAFLSTFSKTECQNLINQGHRVIKTLFAQIISLNDLLIENCDRIFPDLLSIDVEGLEMSILRQINFNENFPKVICVETLEYSKNGKAVKRPDIADFILDNGYVLYADTHLNSIFVHKAF